MKYWVFTGKEAIGPFAPDEMAKVSGFGPETVVAPDGAGSADAWKPARTFPELQTMLFKPPPIKPAAPIPVPAPILPKAPEPAPVVEAPQIAGAAKPDGFFCPLCEQRIATDDLCCAKCGEVLPKEIRERFLASLGSAQDQHSGGSGFWRKYIIYVTLGLAALAVAGSLVAHFSRKSSRKAEDASRAGSLPPIDLKVPAPAAEPVADSTALAGASSEEEPPKKTAKKRRESRATLAQRRAKVPKPAEPPAPKKSAEEMSVDELTKYLNRGKEKPKN